MRKPSKIAAGSSPRNSCTACRSAAGISHMTRNTATFAMMRDLIAGESGPGPKENEEYDGPRGGRRRITSNLPRSERGHPAPELGELLDLQQVCAQREGGHADADCAEHAERLSTQAIALKRYVQDTLGVVRRTSHDDRRGRDLQRCG